MKPIDKFYTTEYRVLIENMNKISENLLKAKWYFLAALASFGFTYSYIFQQQVKLIKIEGNQLRLERGIELSSSMLTIAIFVAFFLGNIVFWLISKYCLSHGFLYRIIQAKAAKKEIFFSKKLSDINENEKERKENEKERKRWIKDPSEKDHFYREIDERKDKNGILKDYFLPDQFYPIFWMSLWAIIANSMLTIILLIEYKLIDNNIYYFILVGTPSMLMIFNLFSYLIDKINRYINSYCKFEINIAYHNEPVPFYSLPVFVSKHRILSGFLISFILISLIIISLMFFSINLCLLLELTIFFFIFFFWIPLFGIIIHLWKFISPATSKPATAKSNPMNPNEINVELNCRGKVLCTIFHMWKLLYAIV
ncbi:MAG: hypothetical protein ACOZF2_10160 [Thermodesulfobacteriota bacterium]